MVAVTARGGSVELESLCLGIRLYVRTNARGLLLEHFPALAGWLLCRAGELNLIAELDRHYTGRFVLAGRASRVYFKFSCMSV